MTNYSISEAEWQVMQVIWARRTATAAEVIAELAKVTSWQHRTVRTLLARLVEKQVLAAESQGHRYVYRPLVSRDRCIRREVRTFLKKVFAGDANEMLVHFVRDAKIDARQIEELKRLLDKKRSSHP